MASVARCDGERDVRLAVDPEALMEAISQEVLFAPRDATLLEYTLTRLRGQVERGEREDRAR